MANTLLDQLRSVFTPAATTDLARTLGENAANTQKALDGLLPAITAGVINRAESNQGAATLYRLLKNTPFDTDPSVQTLVETGSHRQKAAESGLDLLRQLYDDRVDRLSESTAQYSGVSAKSATTLAGLVMSVLMGFLHKQVSARNLNEAQLATLLRDERDTVRGAVPATLAGLIGWFIGTDANRPVTGAIPIRPETVTTARREDEDDRAAAFPWLRWLLIALGLLLLFWLLSRSCSRNGTDNTTSTTTTTDATSNDPAVVATDTVASDLDGNELAPGADSSGASAGGASAGGASAGSTSTGETSGPEVRVGVDLPNGRKLNLAERSFTYSLATFLADKSSKAPKVFTFDNLTFETNSAQITAKARPNVDDLIQIMQAYPSLTIRIEGNTDSTGPDAVNDPLSAERAQAVKDALVKAGIQASRVATRELGDRKPVASNQTETGREKNRRIDVVVTKI